MTHYFTIRIRENVELSIKDCMKFAFVSVHKALGRLGMRNVGVSFPEMDADKNQIGTKIRLHGSISDLKNIKGRLHTTDIFVMEDILPVPEVHSFVNVSRVQGQNEAKKRREIRRGKSPEEVESFHKKIASDFLMKQKVGIGSILSSTGRVIPCFFIRQTKVDREKLVHEGFSSYGLSGSATVPYF